jgi:hypothetical protein
MMHHTNNRQWFDAKQSPTLASVSAIPPRAADPATATLLRAAALAANYLALLAEQGQLHPQGVDALTQLRATLPQSAGCNAMT